VAVTSNSAQNDNNSPDFMDCKLELTYKKPKIVSVDIKIHIRNNSRSTDQSPKFQTDELKTRNDIQLNEISIG